MVAPNGLDAPLPQDDEAESAVIASCSLDRKALAVARALLGQDDFASQRCARAFAGCLQLDREGVEPSPAAVMPWVTRGDEEAREWYANLIETVGYTCVATVDHFAQRVRDASDRRQGLETADRLSREMRNGVAPSEAFERATGALLYIKRASEAPAERLSWRSLDDVEADTLKAPREFVWPGLLATRTVAVLGGQPKAGKSEIIGAFIAAMTRGEKWLGFDPQEPRTVLLVSEEGDHDLLDKATRYGADRSRVRVLSRDAVGSPPVWPALIAECVKEAAAVQASILVIDTFSFWAGIEGEGERSEGVMRERTQALQPCRMANLAVLVTHHSVKDGEVEGIAALRGSGAFGGAVESVAIFKRQGRDPLTPRRVLDVFSRIAPCVPQVVERIVDEGGTPFFKRHAEEGEEGPKGANVAADRSIRAELGKTGVWMDRRAIERATGLKSRALDARLPACIKGGSIVRMGTGMKGAPFLYALPGTPVQ